MRSFDGKGGQVTIFIIVAIMIVSVLLVFFLWAQPTYFSEGVGIKGFEGCVEDALESGISELEGKAGFIEADFTYSYNGEELTYLCYTNNFYETCVVQVPFLKNVFDENLEALIRDDVDACYDASLASLREEGYDVDSGAVDYNVEIEPGAVRLEIDAPVSVGSQSFARFSVEANAPVYDMVMIATSILQFETKYGDSDVSSMMLYYPDYYIEKIKRGEGTTIYVLEHKTFGNKFKFASRSLVFPAGYDI
ncbi:hypothetical protein HN903_03745 [archaeon]|jgi:hypothetical protein|nr:hypothetical protein [archaeon]MBT7128843.1 hypothetical protein [archaeon]